jgi:hypothetical protein
MKVMATRCARAGIVVGFLLGAMVSGCALGPGKRVATPAELDTFGTRSYAGYEPKEVQQAAITALKVQGYEIVTEEPRIRTSPKLVHVSASSTYSETAGNTQSFAESVAWDIDVKPGPQATLLHAVPRASVNGIPMEQVYYDWAERTFGLLMKDVDASLPVKH